MIASGPLFVPDGQNSIHDGAEHERSGGKALLDPTDTALLLLDHQSGLFQTVKESVQRSSRRSSAPTSRGSSWMFAMSSTSRASPL